MVIITGLGRSGTSVLAQICTKLGVAVGGEWNASINAGLEDTQVARLNDDIMTFLGRKSANLDHGQSQLPQWLRGHSATTWLLKHLGRRSRHYLKQAYWKAQGGVQLGDLDSDTISRAAERFRDEVLAIPFQGVVKDPRFLLTLPVWICAEANIERIIVTTRSLDPVIASRSEASHLATSQRAPVISELLHDLGCCMHFANIYRIPSSILVFPNFLNQPQSISNALGLNDPEDVLAVQQALEEVYNPAKVHHG